MRSKRRWRSRAAEKRHAAPKELCTAVSRFYVAEGRGAEVPRDPTRPGAAFPRQAIAAAKATHEKTLKFRDVVCNPARAATRAPDAERRHRRARPSTPAKNTKTEHRNLQHADRQPAGQINAQAGRFGCGCDRQLGRHAGAGLAAALSAACAARPADRLLASAHSLLVVFGARGGRRRHARAPSLAHIALFFIGAFAMRGAGCTWNDIVDRDLDARRRAHALAADSLRPGQPGAGGSVPRCCRR